ncbi:MAG: hypothetical protein GF364_15020 [Candidatus Lokiarchaeota archaeon]|nr:hypothetical protein [Candidatus Lokiarchaeota archaeon]
MKLERDEEYYREICDLIDENTWIISDTHFDHANMLKYEPIRQRMAEKNHTTIEKYMMKEWNKLVQFNETIFHLGDFAWKNISMWAQTVAGKGILMYGNHDHGSITKYTSNSWSLIRDAVVDLDDKIHVIPISRKQLYKTQANFLIKEIMGKRIMFSHLPYLDDCEYDLKFQDARQFLYSMFTSYDCELNIHGHIHGNTANCPNCMNLSVEQTDFRPIRLHKLIKKFFKNL